MTLPLVRRKGSICETNTITSRGVERAEVPIPAEIAHRDLSIGNRDSERAVHSKADGEIADERVSITEGNNVGLRIAPIVGKKADTVAATASFRANTKVSMAVGRWAVK